MPKEIERRWLLRHIPTPRFLTHPRNIRQAYLPNGVRVRVVNLFSINAKPYAEVGMKTGSGLVRSETETFIPVWLAEKLMELTDTGPVEKDRYTLDAAHQKGTEYTIDIFSGNHKGLIIAEKEYVSEQAAMQDVLPTMIFEHVIKEITGNPRYDNYTLARTQQVPTEV